MKTFTFEFARVVEINVDESLEHLLEDAKFQDRFGNSVTSLEELARHIAWYRAVLDWNFVLPSGSQNKFRITSMYWK